MEKKPKIGIFVIAYQAVSTLISAIERIPESIKKQAKEIYIFDDCSNDNTYYAGLGYKHLTKNKKLHIYRNDKNLGYGGNQKKGYRYAIKKGFDIVVMLHGDVQYSPEKIPDLIQPLINGESDATFGSRILQGRPIKEGMPYWKYIGNRFLTKIENYFLDLNLTEYHTGFRAYRIDALKKVDFEKCSDGYNFDTDIIILFKENDLIIKEIPIPTHYGKESHQISFKKSFIYGLSILKSVISYRLRKNAQGKNEKLKGIQK